MKFLEKDLEQIIYETPNSYLQERGLNIQGCKKKQLYIGNYGIADLVTFSREYKCPSFTDGEIIPILNITVYEFKKDKINIDTFLQAIRYVRGIQEYLQYRDSNLRCKFNVVLIGSSVELRGNSFCYLPDLIGSFDEHGQGCIQDVSFYSYDYKVDGIIFSSNSGYTLTSHGFNKNNTQPF